MYYLLYVPVAIPVSIQQRAIPVPVGGEAVSMTSLPPEFRAAFAQQLDFLVKAIDNFESQQAQPANQLQTERAFLERCLQIS